MHYSILRNLLHGVYMIDPNKIWEYQFMLTSLRNGIEFQKEDEFKNTIPYNVDGDSGDFTFSSSTENQPTRISVHSIRDIMLRDDMGCGHVGTRTIGNRLLQSDSDPEVFAHILIFDSPGGAGNAVVEIADAIKACEKPVYAWVDGYCASAAIYSASYCKEIHAHRATDVVGSVGTMVQFRGTKSGDKDSNGVYEYRIYASKSTKKNQKFEEAINNGNTVLVKEWLDIFNERFIQDMKTNIPTTTEELHLTGDTWEASEVLGVFVTSIKTFNELVQHVIDQYEAEKPKPKKTSNSNSQTNKSLISMNPKLSALVALLAVSNIETVEEYASLSEEQLETISAALNKLPEMETQLQAATQAQATAETSLQTANETIAQRDATITANETTIAELKGKPGTKGATAQTDGDDKPDENNKAVSEGKSLAEGITAVANEYLGGQ